jgi:uncharacterized protein YjbI with pentapeptide repeats
VSGTFAGKYAFRSTNTQSAQYYLTSSPQQGSVYPAVLAPALTPTEHVILYMQSDGSLVAALAVPDTVRQTVTVAYLAGNSDLAFVATDPAVANASKLRIVPFGATSGAWSIFNTGTWTPLYYKPNTDMSLLLYAMTPPPPGTLETLAGVCVTPGHDVLASTKQGENADLSYTDLSGLAFDGVDFTGANFTGAILDSTKFNGATLTRATFAGATIGTMDVTGATLDGAVLAGLDLSSMVWGSGISAVGAHFEGSMLVGCRIGSASATAKFTGAHFDSADLARVDLTGATLSSATFFGANLTGAVLDGSDMTQALFGGSGTVRPATLAYASMSNVILSGANLFGVDFTSATLYGGETKVNDAATIQQADFSNAYLQGISFANSNLQGARFDGACLISADFTGARLGAGAGNGMAASFVGASLPGAIFTGAGIAGVNFANAAVSFANGSFPVRYCTVTGLMPPPPASIPMNCHATTGLDLTTLRPDTVCPNGAMLATNQAQGIALAAMLVGPGAPACWYAASCLAG